jgi:aminoglycoside phosphotransferase (APT) family kinase protein
VEALHDDELAVDADLVRRLVARSLPAYAGMPVEPLDSSGSTNALFRLGDDLLVRLPRQPGGSTTIEKEARWLPTLAPHLTVAVPEVVTLGSPGLGYPEQWAVTRWIHGCVPSVPYDPSGGPSGRLALDLALLVSELGRVEVPSEGAEDPELRWYRAGRLADLDGTYREALGACEEIPDLGLDLGRALRIWERAIAAEEGAPPATASWVHADLLAENLLVRDGALAAVLDFGALCVGDPTVDLVVAWEVLDAEGRGTFRRALNVDDATWERARGWALFIAVITFPYYWRTMPARCASRRAMAAAVLAEE